MKMYARLFATRKVSLFHFQKQSGRNNTEIKFPVCNTNVGNNTTDHQFSSSSSVDRYIHSNSNGQFLVTITNCRRVIEKVLISLLKINQYFIVYFALVPTTLQAVPDAKNVNFTSSDFRYKGKNEGYLVLPDAAQAVKLDSAKAAIPFTSVAKGENEFSESPGTPGMDGLSVARKCENGSKGPQVS